MEETIRSNSPDPAEKKHRGWIKWCSLALCLILVVTVVAFCVHPTEYTFDKHKYPVLGEWMNDKAIADPSHKDWEDMCNTADWYKDACLIAECTVLPGSLNKETGSSISGQVLTPIQIDKIYRIHSQESSAEIKEGQTAYVIEPFCYVSHSIPIFGAKGIRRLDNYNPLVPGKYILFLCADSDYYQHVSESFDETTLFLRPFPEKSGAYQIASATEVEENRIDVNPYFWEYWSDVMETYTD